MDVIGRAVVVFVMLWLLMRLGGKRQLSDLSAFELVVIVVLGDLVGQIVMQENFSLTAGFVAVAVFVLMSHALAEASLRWRKARRVIEGRPTVVVVNGVFDDDAMEAEGLSRGDVMEAARGEGLEAIEDVKWALIETNGNLTFVKA
jgi:uncharacterized membrane protein YcaP (DUF421 family)